MKAMDYFSSPTQFCSNVHCGEGRQHHNIMSSVVPKKEIEESWASERVARFINLFAIIAIRSRVAENCNADVTLEDALTGDKAFRRVGRKRSDVVARCHQNHQVPCGDLQTRRTPRRLTDLVVLVEHAGSILSRGQQGRDGRRHLKDCMARSQHKNLFHSGRSCWRDRYPQNR